MECVPLCLCQNAKLLQLTVSGIMACTSSSLHSLVWVVEPIRRLTVLATIVVPCTHHPRLSIVRRRRAGDDDDVTALLLHWLERVVAALLVGVLQLVLKWDRPLSEKWDWRTTAIAFYTAESACVSEATSCCCTSCAAPRAPWSASNTCVATKI